MNMKDYKRKFKKQLIDEDLSASTASESKGGKFNPQDFTFEGILDVLNDPPKGYKEFCGKLIELNFQHVVETKFNLALQKYSDVESLVSSHYFEDDADYYNSLDFDPAGNVGRIRNGEAFTDLQLVQSEYEDDLASGNHQ